MGLLQPPHRPAPPPPPPPATEAGKLTPRLEAARRGTRRLDAAALHAAGFEAVIEPRQNRWKARRPGRGSWRAMPEVTHHIDDALWLREQVAPGSDWAVSSDTTAPRHPGARKRFTATVYARTSARSLLAQGAGGTPALALTCAVLDLIEQGARRP